MSTASVSIAPAASYASARSVLLPQRLILFGAAAAACCVASILGALHGPAVVALAIAAIAVAMWHGAYDQVQAEQLLSRIGPRWPLVFLGSYALLAAFTLLGWLLAPLASLLLFLLYSAWHFGTEPEIWTPTPLASIAAVALGAVPIVAACHWHSGEAAAIFAQMLHGEGNTQGLAAALAGSLGASCWPVAAVAAAGILAGKFGVARGMQVELLGVLAIELALFCFADPLLAFTVFFCCWHTPEHLVTTSLPEGAGETLAGKLARNLKAGFLPWVLALCLTAGILLWGRHEAIAYQAEIFIVLSALTVPHMALNELGRATAAGPKLSHASDRTGGPSRAI